MDIAALINQFYKDHKDESMLFPPNKEIYRGQCVQPWMFFMRDYLHLPVLWYDEAYKYAGGGNGYIFVKNNPNDPNQIPPVGAMIIFRSDLPGSQGSGHIAGFWQNLAGQHTFISIDSNWGGKTLHQVTHNWQYVDGWLVPRPPVVTTASVTINTQPQGDEMIANNDQAHLAYQVLRPNGDGNDGEIAATAGKRTWVQFMTDGKSEREARDAAIRDSEQVRIEQQNTINQLNRVVTDLNANGVQTRQELDAALGKISSLTTDLTTANDKITDYQKKIANPLLLAVSQVQNGPIVSKANDATWFVRFLAAIMFRKKS